MNEKPTYEKLPSGEEFKKKFQKKLEEMCVTNIDIEQAVEKIKQQIEPFLELSSGTDQAHIILAIEEIKVSKDRDDLLIKILNLTNLIFKLRNLNPMEFEKIYEEQLRDHYYNSGYGAERNLQPLNRLLAWGIDGDTIELHIPPNWSLPPFEIKRLWIDGLKKLVIIVEENPLIVEICGKNKLVKDHTKFFESLGFSVKEDLITLRVKDLIAIYKEPGE